MRDNSFVLQKNYYSFAPCSCHVLVAILDFQIIHEFIPEVFLLHAGSGTSDKSTHVIASAGIGMIETIVVLFTSPCVSPFLL